MTDDSDRMMTAGEVPWTLPPIDPLMFDDDTATLAMALREAASQIASLTATVRRQSARIEELIAELRNERTRGADR